MPPVVHQDIEGYQEVFEVHGYHLPFGDARGGDEKLAGSGPATLIGSGMVPFRVRKRLFKVPRGLVRYSAPMVGDPELPLHGRLPRHLRIHLVGAAIKPWSATSLAVLP